MRRARRLPLEALEPYLLDAPPPHGPPPPEPKADPLTWLAVFGNERPVEIEVGFGKGLFLLTAGQARLDVNFLGIEIERKFVLLTATRLAKRGLCNVRVTASDARWFLQVKVPPASVQAIHVYFPDPWWKTRHKKRKLLTEDFVRLCAQALVAEGAFHLATDVADYFTQAQALMSRLRLLHEVARPEDRPPAHDLDYLTHFERKYRKAGRAIHRAVYRNSI